MRRGNQQGETSWKTRKQLLYKQGFDHTGNSHLLSENHHEKQIENMSSHLLSCVIADGAISLPNWILNRFYTWSVSRSSLKKCWQLRIYTNNKKKNRISVRVNHVCLSAKRVSIIYIIRVKRRHYLRNGVIHLFHSVSRDCLLALHFLCNRRLNLTLHTIQMKLFLKASDWETSDTCMFATLLNKSFWYEYLRIDLRS